MDNSKSDSQEDTKKFGFPADLIHNNDRITDPSTFARENQAASWLCLTGEEFAAMEGGISYSQVQQAVNQAANIISDPPKELNLDLARQHIAALDKLPRPTLVTCRMGPRSSAVAYMYSGLRAGADPADVIAEAEKNGAPFCNSGDLKDWVKSTIEILRNDD